MTIKIVCSGTWLYDGLVEMPVDVITLNYDWWHSLAELDNQLEEGEQPIPLGPDGCLYYVRFRRAGEKSDPTWPDSYGHATFSEAIEFAESKVTGGIKWNPASVSRT